VCVCVCVCVQRVPKKRIHVLRKENCNATCLSHGDASIHLINAMF